MAEYITKYSFKGLTEKRPSRKCCILIGLFFIIATIMLLTGIFLIIKKSSSCEKLDNLNQTSSKRSLALNGTDKSLDLSVYCRASKEANRIQLSGFLQKCLTLYLKIYPTEILTLKSSFPRHVINEFARKITPFNPTPEVLKDIGDHRNVLLKELQSLNADERYLKPKENQILAEMKVFLEQFMSHTYDLDFYSGSWMFGPNLFCMDKICDLAFEFNTFTYYFRPESKEDIEYIILLLTGYKTWIEQYMNNVKLGVQTGMVRTKLSCQAGADALKKKYEALFIYGAVEGTDKSWWSGNIVSLEFYKHLPQNVHDDWYNQYGKPIPITLINMLRRSISTPIIELHEYLVNIYSRNCPPDDEFSGLAHLPLDHVYLDGKPQQRAIKTLPITNQTLNGKEMYRNIVPRITTTDITPEKVYEEGLRQLEIFYPEIIEISKKYTKEKDEKLAVQKMKKIINGAAQWHGALNFPKNESDSQAHMLCVSDDTAKKYCPVRWRSIQKWANYLNRVLAMIHPLLTPAFHFTGGKNSVPNCPIKMTPHYNPSNGAMYFDSSDAECSKPTGYGLPFFLEKYGPRFQEWSVSGHEGRPGHHFQYQGFIELFANPCKDDLASFFHQKGYFQGFIEGWALYAENPVLSHDVNLYKDNILQKLGMYKWQVWRAVRLIVDTGLHYRGENRTWALKQLEKYAWDTTDFSRKEITRYMSCPGQANAYMIGRLEILKARKKAIKELGELFNLKDFHYQILSLGQVPVTYMSKHIDRYISCVKNHTQMFCDYILTPLKDIPKGNIKWVKEKRPPPPRPERLRFV